MRQAFHILKKDIRHLWIEICVSLAAMILVTYFEWRQSLPNHSSEWYFDVLPLLLLVLCWWLMVVRLIQDEALVGDRQFWITRPYVWYKLAAAKVLFIISWIALPLVLSQIFLPIFDGWPVRAHVWEILGISTGNMLVLILPCVVVAALTRTIPQWMMGIVVLILTIVGFTALDEYVPNSHISTGRDMSENLQIILFILFAVSGLTILYYRRKRTLATIAFALALLSIPAVMIATPYKTLIDRAFPVDVNNPLRLDLTTPVQDTHRDFSGKKLSLYLPFAVSGVPQGKEMQVAGVRLMLEGGDGNRWQSDWNTSYAALIGQTKETSTYFTISRDDYTRLASQTLTAHLEVAIKEIHETNPERIVLQPSFQTARLGRCRISENGRDLFCRSAFHENRETTLTFRYSESACPVEGFDKSTSNVPAMTKRATTFRSGPFSSITTTTFSNFQYSPEKSPIAIYCPGTPVTFTTPKASRRYRINFEFSLPHLELYARKNGDYFSMSSR